MVGVSTTHKNITEKKIEKKNRKKNRKKKLESG
nr:MAG TPA: hypothetical protein [Crassvirales sp.]